ncbi:kinesin-like protein KIF3A [Pangshura tecta]
MDAGQAKQEACVQAAVGLRCTAGSGKQESFRVVNEDSSRLIFIDKADKNIQEGCFTFDGIFSLDTGQDEVFLELVRPLLAMVPLGYSVSLLLWEAHCAGTKPQPQGTGQHHSIIQQVIETIFQDLKLPGDGREQLQTVSFVQLCADGNAWDLLSPRNQALHVLDVPPLGLMVEKASEIVVSNSTAAYRFYVRGLEDSPAPSQGCSQQSQVQQHAAMCASLFTLTVEQELEGCRRQRSAVRILEFLRGAGPCVEPLSPLLQALAPGELPDDAGFLPWILKRVLEGNNLTFLLLCLTLPDASGEEILSALSLAEQVRGLAKKISPTHWDPAKAAWRQRAEIRELRAQLLSSSSHTVQKSLISQLRRVLRDLQVLKNQSWEKKKEMSEAFEGNGSHHPEAKGRIPLWPGRDDQLTNQVLTDRLRSQEFLDRSNPKPDGDVPGFVPLCNDKGGEAATSSLGWFGRMPPSMGAVTGEKPLQRGASRTQEPTGTANVTGTVGSWASQQHPTLELQFAVAKARRQHLREQHQQLIQQELLKLEEELAGNQELPPPPRDSWCWPKEKAVLTLQLEALQRERDEAEKDLEALYQQHRREAEAQKQHVLQVFRAYRGLSEEQTDALDRWYRKLLQEALQDAIFLSAQNQQLRAHSQLGCTDHATQTDPHF